MVAVSITSIFCGCYLYTDISNRSVRNNEYVIEEYPYPVNKNGETYGGDIYTNSPDIKPDLMAAYGDNGVFGYVKAKDFDDNVMNPEEINGDKSRRVLLLYEKDGETIIGTFTLQ